MVRISAATTSAGTSTVCRAGGRVEEAYLEVTRDGRQQVVALDAERVTLGRAAGNDLSFPSDGTVSGRHAIVERQEDGWTIRDLDSSNGTYVNGQRLEGPRLLRAGDLVTLGKERVVFRIQQPLPGPSQPAGPGGYLAVTEEWQGANQGPAQPPARPAAPPAAPPGARAADSIGQDQRHGGAGSRDEPAGLAPGAPGRDAAQPIHHRGSAVIRGVARGVQVGQRHNQYNVLSFRVERYDSSGNRLAPVGVEFVRFRSGLISDGEEVEVTGRWSKGTLRAEKITNLSTRAEMLGPTTASKVGQRVFVTCFLVFFFGVLAAIVIGVILSVLLG
jgi:hypothetical protein